MVEGWREGKAEWGVSVLVFSFQQKIEDEDEEHFEGGQDEQDERSAECGVRSAEWVSARRRNEHAGRVRSPC